MTRSCIGLTTALAIALTLSQPLCAQPGDTDDHIKIDQFGYLVGGRKVAVISNPVDGFNAGDSFYPGGRYEVRRAGDNAVMFSGWITAWNGGAVHPGSGDRVWWFDFSSLDAPGHYYVYDPDNDASSYLFQIGDAVYADALVQAMRTFYYQRCGTPKAEPFAEANWADAHACHLGPEQDSDCRFVLYPQPLTSRDLSGGWHDAGDYNKYVNYIDEAIHNLLFAYEQQTNVWADSHGIPESGNGIPDLIDEIKWELDWLLKMQLDDGSVIHKLATTTWDRGSPPSSDHYPRQYAPPTASATISACGAFAHAAIVYQSLLDPGMQAFGNILEAAAVAAWDWLEAVPTLIPSYYDNNGFVNAAAEDSPYMQFALRVSAASYLFVLTGDARYRDHFDSEVYDVHLMQWRYAYPFESTIQDALLYYSRAAGATGAVVADVFSAYRSAMQGYFNKAISGEDPYRAYLESYNWGSNSHKADMGNMFLNVIEYELDTANQVMYRQAAAEFVHYLHGVNPLALVYLTNMGDHGAENSVPEFFHYWFGDGTVWDNVHESLYGPAPGFLVGGPNPFYSPDPIYTGPPIEPPENQPDQKSYKSWNNFYPEDSYEVTEGAVYFQSDYVRLLTWFFTPETVTTSTEAQPSLVGGRAYPNPFSSSTSIRFALPQAGPLLLSVFGIDGRKIATLVDGEQPDGTQVFTWNGRDDAGRQVASGLYFYRLETASHTETRPIVYLK